MNNECPLCGTVVSGDECNCGAEEEELLIAVYRLAVRSDNHLEADYYTAVSTTRHQLKTFLREEECCASWAEHYHLFTVPRSWVPAAALERAVAYWVSNEQLQDSITKLTELEWETE